MMMLSTRRPKYWDVMNVQEANERAQKGNYVIEESGEKDIAVSFPLQTRLKS